MTQISYQTMQTNTIKYMLKFVNEFELVKAKKHKKFETARAFFKAKNICFQNFYKFYKRFIMSGRDETAILPLKRGPRPKYRDYPNLDNNYIVNKVLEHRKQGYNKFIIADILQKDNKIKREISASTVYRIFVQYGVSKMKKIEQERKVKIIRDFAGSLVHVDCHFLPKGIITAYPQKKFFVLGAVDDYSRIVWVEVLESTKAIDACFAMMDVILAMHQQYGIKCNEVMTDNGSEFCGKKDVHPYERLLSHFGIKHIKTQPYRPQTNGKIERFWRTFHEDVIEGVEFETVQQMKDAVLGYNFFYNEKRPHQGIDGKTPLKKLKS